METQPETEINEEATAAKEPGPFFEAVRRVLLAGIGAVALTQDEVEKIVDRLVERGELAEKEGRKLANEMFEKRKQRRGEALDHFTSRVEELIDRMNVPTKADIQKLNDKIAILTQKIEELKRE